MKEIQLNAQLRENGKSNKKELSGLRATKMIPGVVYGGKKEPVSVVVNEKELLAATKTGGANAILHLKHPKGEDTVILKELQRHVVSNQPIHADFQRISLKEKIEVKVPLHVIGEAPGVKLHGGILEHVLREFRVRCLPTEIPQRIDVDVSRLEVNESLKVSDIKTPEGIEVLDAADHLVVSVFVPAEEAATPAAGAEGAAAAAEPEVIAKGKKDEEGAEGEAKAGDKKAAAPAAAAGDKKKEAGK
ncbi:MAG: 50S ribosomal protein L25 [Elusimicrobia bacterium]|nr:50S ribosomal protein L25 [Elusimicrobiota bacterium]